MMYRKTNNIFYFTIDVLVAILCVLGAIQTVNKPMISEILSPKTQDTSLLSQEISDQQRSYILHADSHTQENIREWLTDTYKSGDTIQTLSTPILAYYLGSKTTILTKYYSGGYFIIQIITALLFFVPGILVIRRKSGDIAAQYFHHLTLSIALLLMLTWGSMSVLPKAISYFLRAFFPVTYLLFSFFSFRFSTQFPVKLKSRKKTEIFYTALGAVLAVGGFFSGFAAVLNAAEYLPLHLHVLTFCKLYAVVLSLHALLLFFVNYHQTREEYLRRHLRWVIFGSCISVGTYVVFWQIPQLLGLPTIPEEIMILFSGVAPICYAIAIVRYRAFNIDVFIRKSTVYGVLLIIVVTLLYLVQMATAHFLQSYLSYSSTLNGVIEVGIGVFLFLTIREFFQKKLEEVFFKTHVITNRERVEFGRKLSESYDIFQVRQTLFKVLTSLFKPEKIYLLQRSSEHSATFMLHSFMENAVSRAITLRPQRMPEHNQIFVNDDAVEPNMPEYWKEIPAFKRWNIGVCIPLWNQNGSVIGLCAVGKKKFGTRYVQEEILLMESLCFETAISWERVRLTAELAVQQEEARRLEEVNAMKTFFVSSVSHELKTPLTSIRLFAEMLVENAYDEKKREKFARIIGEESQRLSRLIDNLLNFSRIERGVKTYHFSSQNLNELCRQMLEVMEYQCAMNKVELSVEYSPVALPIYADSDALKESFMNIVSNAIRYSSPPRRISIQTGLRQNFGFFSVTDNGFGIAENEKTEIFRPFFRSPNKNTFGIEGMGIGLSLVKHICDAHNAVIEVESTLNQGSTFILLFPLAEKKLG